jgi:hypothetical protein
MVLVLGMNWTLIWTTSTILIFGIVGEVCRTAVTMEMKMMTRICGWTRMNELAEWDMIRDMHSPYLSYHLIMGHSAPHHPRAG